MRATPSGERTFLRKNSSTVNPPGSGSLLVGSRGILYSPNDYGSRYILLPENDFKDFEKPEAWLPRNGRGDLGMKQEWAEAIRGASWRCQTNYAGLLTETILLGNVAMRVQEKELFGMDWHAV